MPRPGVPNNPGGANGADDPVGGATSVAGLIHRQMGLTTAAPMPTVPGVTAPKQDQRAALKGSQPQSPQPAGQAAPAAPPAPIPYPVRLATAWAQIAMIPGATPIVKQMASEAAQSVR